MKNIRGIRESKKVSYIEKIEYIEYLMEWAINSLVFIEQNIANLDYEGSDVIGNDKF